jgi:chondroitin 4-sulfotransferase 11
MIINYKYKFLFIHIHKTAGSSIRNTLLSLPESYYLGHDHSFVKDINIEDYENYFKFAIVRNPWERLVSWYFSILNLRSSNNFKTYITKNSNNFSEFLNCTDVIWENSNMNFKKSKNNKYSKIEYYKSISFNQLDYVSDKNQKIAIDYIGRFEKLNESWQEVCSNIGLNLILRKDKIGNYKRDYRSFYSDKNDIEKVRKIYFKDINYFKYEFL